jgi:uncharacterized membrane protein
MLAKIQLIKCLPNQHGVSEMAATDKKDATEAAHHSRLAPLDALRGLLIILMALDHANYFIAQRHPSGEHWGGNFPSYDSPIAFLTRACTHLSAPGFFFLMGTGMILYTAHRSSIGWTHQKIRLHLALRGMILILLQFVIVNPIWKISPIPFPDWYQGVLVALGATMIIATLLLRFRAGILLMVTAVLSMVIEITHPNPALWGALNNTPLGLIFGFSGGTQTFWVNYPILAWLEFVTFGMAFGVWFRDKPETGYQWAFILGIALLAAFLPLRALNGFGNIRPMEGSTWIDFFNVVKYPPSWSFAFLTMGLNLLILGLMSRSMSRLGSVVKTLIVFGRVPLFVYISHLLLYALLGRLFTPSGSPYLVMYAFWLMGIAILYYPAKWYARLKGSSRARPILQFL